MTDPVVLVVVAGFLVVGGPVVVLGVVSIRRGVAAYRDHTAFAATGQSTVDRLRAGEDVRVTGTAVVDDGTLTGAVSGAEAVGLRYRVDQYVPGDTSRDYRPVHEDREVVSFRLRDDTGSVLVTPTPEALDPGDAHATSVRVESNEDPPSGIRAYLDRTEALDDPVPGVGIGTARVGGQSRYYREWSIRPGDEVLVSGRVDRDPADGDLVLETGGERGLVTGRSADAVAAGDLTSVALYLVGGTGLVVGPLAGVGLLLAELGVV